MKHAILFLTWIFIAMTATTFAQNIAQNIVVPPYWKFGYATLHQIEDTSSGFAATTFPTVDKATFDKYATDGRIPSSVSAFLLEYPSTGEYVLIDATMGNGNFTANLGHAMRDKFEPEKVALVLITHLHGDHIAGLLDGQARRFPNAKVFCSKPEYDYWITQNNAMVNRVKKAYGDDFRAGFEFDQGFALGGRTELELIPLEENNTLNDTKVGGNGERRGYVTVTPISAAGHTPGHTVFLIESSNFLLGQSPCEKLMVVGDLLHAAALQFPMPEVCASFDMDKAEAVQARRRILDLAAEENIPIAGIHFPKPGIGFVKKNADGYEFTLIKKTLIIGFRWNDNDSADYNVSVLADYKKNGEILRDRPAAEALAWLETELKSGNYTIIEVHDNDKRDYAGGKSFFEEIVKLAEKYQLPYSVQYAISMSPGSPVIIHFPQEVKP